MQRWWAGAASLGLAWAGLGLGQALGLGRQAAPGLGLLRGAAPAPWGPLRQPCGCARPLIPAFLLHAKLAPPVLPTFLAAAAALAAACLPTNAAPPPSAAASTPATPACTQPPNLRHAPPPQVFLGAASVLSNGTLLSRVGTAAVALMAAARRVPGEPPTAGSRRAAALLCAVVRAVCAVRAVRAVRAGAACGLPVNRCGGWGRGMEPLTLHTAHTRGTPAHSAARSGALFHPLPRPACPPQCWCAARRTSSTSECSWTPSPTTSCWARSCWRT